MPKISKQPEKPLLDANGNVKLTWRGVPQRRGGGPRYAGMALSKEERRARRLAGKPKPADPANAPTRPETTPLASYVPNRFLRLPEVLEVTGLKTTSLYARMKRGTFPQSISLGGRAVAWRAKDIDQWCKDVWDAAHPEDKVA